MRRRWRRWVGVGLLLLFGLFLVADVVMVQYLESRGAAELARTMSAEEARLDLGGFPFIPRFIRGRLSDVSGEVRGASAAGGLRVQRVETRMDEVSFSAPEIFALARSSFATKTEVSAEQPIVMLELGEADLEEFIRRAVPVVGDVEVKASGIEVRFIRPDIDPDDIDQPAEEDLTPPARFLPGARDRELRLVLTSVSQIPDAFRAEAARIEGLIDLPRFPKGLDPDVSLRDGVIVVEAQGAAISVEIGEAAGG